MTLTIAPDLLVLTLLFGFLMRVRRPPASARSESDDSLPSDRRPRSGQEEADPLFSPADADRDVYAHLRD